MTAPKTAVALVLAGALALASAAADPAPLSLGLAQALDRGLKNNLGIQADGLQLDQKAREDALSWNVFVPKVNGSASLIRSVKSDEDLKINEYASAPRTSAQVSLDAQWSFNLALVHAIDATKLEYRRGVLSFALAKKRLTRDIKKAYFGLVLARESVKILEDARNQAQARLKQARALADAGSGSALTVLAEEANAASFEMPLAEQEDGILTLESNLRTLLGLAPGTPFDLTDGLPDRAAATPPPGGGEGGRLDLACLQTALDGLQTRVDAGRDALFPSLFFKLTLDPTFQADLGKPDQYKNKPVQDLWKFQSGMLVVGVTLPVDALVPGSSLMTEWDRARASLQAGQLRLAYARQAAQAEVDTIVQELRRMDLRRDYARKSVDLAENLYRQTLKAYESGAKTRLDLQDALHRLNGARFDNVKDRYSYAARLADLEYALEGGDLAAGLDRL